MWLVLLLNRLHWFTFPLCLHISTATSKGWGLWKTKGWKNTKVPKQGFVYHIYFYVVCDGLVAWELQWRVIFANMQAKHIWFSATKEVANQGTPKGGVGGSGAGSDSLAVFWVISQWEETKHQCFSQMKWATTYWQF